eukprot:1548160-Pyramimonas_sp.AAC.1
MEDGPFSKCGSRSNAVHTHLEMCTMFTDGRRAAFRIRLPPQRRAHSSYKSCKGKGFADGRALLFEMWLSP